MRINSHGHGTARDCGRGSVALGTTPFASTMSGVLTAECGDANDDGEITASDALAALATAAQR